MPELPDIVVYLEALERRITGQPLERIRLLSPFILRSVSPPISSVDGRRVVGMRRLGKRIVIELEGELFLVLHLMIAGRLRWGARGGKLPGKLAQAVFEFPDAMLIFTEAGPKKRASLHLAQGREALQAFEMGGLDVFTADFAAFSSRITSENHTLKRALADPRNLSGIGNAYSDEILHRARLSPIAQTQKLGAAEIERLYHATRATLDEWIERLRCQTGAGFPDKVTAFRAEMAVHGRYGLPCPVCGTKVARIVYADNETNYCPRCQTGGVLLADRALSRLLKKSWPRSIDELE